MNKPLLSPAAHEAALALRRGDARDAVLKIRALGEESKLGEGEILILGLALLSLQEEDEARRIFNLGLRLKPDHPPFLFNLALAEEKLGRRAEARALLEKCCALGAATGEVFGNLSNLLRAEARYQEAKEAALKALALGAPSAEALNCLALAEAALGERAEAEAHWAEASALQPENAFFWANRANAAADVRDFEAAFLSFEKARSLSRDPALRRDEGMVRLLAGDAEKGAALYEARLEIPGAFAAPATCPRWTGQDLQGKTLLLLSEQGFGDTIQFCRFGAAFVAKGATLIWGVQPALVPLLAGQLPGRVIERGASAPEADFYLPLISVPFALGCFVEKGEAYLKAPPPSFLPPSILLEGAEPKIGLIWAGSATHRRDAERSISLKDLTPIWEAFPEARFYAPFKGAALAEIETCGAPIIDLSDRLKDFAATASLLAQLDAVISVDTAGAHLAGALGVKTCLLLPFIPDWRWGVAGEMTPLYTSLHLCRQSVRGDWGAAIRQAINEIRRSP